MHAVYDFVAGPLAWAALLVFIFGVLGRFVHLHFLMRKKDPTIGAYLSFKYGLRSLAVWSTPFATRNMRLNPLMTVMGFAFHICLLLAPLFLMGHVLMLKDSIGLSWVTLPDAAADVMTIIVLIALVYFAVRRCTDRMAKYVTRPQDFLLLLLVGAPFLTGFLAYHQIFDYMTMLVLHIVSAELLLVLIPFTWLSHMVLGPMVRVYMGSEFGGVRHCKDW